MSTNRNINVTPVTLVRAIRGAKVIEMTRANCIGLSFLLECAAHNYDERSAYKMGDEFRKLAAEWRARSAERS